ncbi:hypothetical protein PIB30_005631 [Stylosanthes scabra]|uniref:Uncharacterized protein n=1 Tax=Stylosanthes scabra TaxID=79078 RepID=A0ABU6T4R0_9FABA|nr:hypothetical protein [Stylosanthes scabra]
MNKANRASNTGGSLHIGGLTTYSAMPLKMAEELKRTPTQSEVFTRTHTKKKDWGQGVDKRLEDANVWARIASDHKRGCIYGHDKVPSRLKLSVYDSEDVSTTSGPVDMREQVTLLNQELTHA